MSELRKHIIETFGFTEDEFNKISAFFKRVEVKKGDYFLQEGQYVRQMGFVEKGILREFFIANDKEVTKWFSTEGYFAVDLSGFLFGRKSKVSYQAIEDVELLVLSKENYNKIATQVPRWDQLEKLFLAKCFSILEDRIVTHLSMNSEERYHQFFKFNPELFNKVPLNFIASMLGMTPETLSRIRNKQSKMIS